MNDHEKYLVMISEFMDGCLDESLKGELAHHLRTCDDCYRAAVAYKTINGSVHSEDSMVEPPADLVSGVMRRIETSEAPETPRRTPQKAETPAKKMFSRVGRMLRTPGKARTYALMAAIVVVLVVTAVAAPALINHNKAKSSDAAEMTMMTTVAAPDEENAADAPAETPAANGGSAPLYKALDTQLANAADGSASEDTAACEDEAPAEAVENETAIAALVENRVKGESIRIKSYDCCAIMLLDGGAKVPDVMQQYAKDQWEEGGSRYVIIDSSDYDQLTESLSKMGIVCEADLYGKMESGNYLLLIASDK